MLKNRNLERERDMLMLYDEQYSRFYLACEVQLYADYFMPLRNFTYDGVEYSDQVKVASMTNKEDCHDKRTKGPSRPLIPVIHNVLYLGEKRWMSKHGLQEMMDIPKILQGFVHLLPEYKINLVDIHDQDPELFQTEWKDIIRVMNYSRKKKELKKYMEEHKEELCRLSVDTREFLAILLDQYDILEDGRVEVKDVCKAWDGAMMMYKEEGKRDGIQQANRQTTQNMYHRGYSAEDAAALVQEPVETVKRWYSEFANE